MQARRITALTVVIVAIVVALALSGCGILQPKGTAPGSGAKPEIIARDGIVGSHAALLSIEPKHPECGTLGAEDPTTHQQKWTSSHSAAQICAVIDRAVGATNLAIDATEAYCSSPEFDAQNLKCTPPAAGTPAAQQLLGKLQSAIGNMNQIMADVKQATGAAVPAAAPPTPAAAPATPTVNQ